MSSFTGTPGKYKDWNEPLEAMLRATESTLHRLKINHEKYKKSKNKLEAALNTPTHYTFTNSIANDNNNMRNHVNVLPKTSNRMNSISEADYSNNKSNPINIDIKYSQSRHAKDYILTESNERENSYSLHRSSLVNNNNNTISTSASRATSLSASYPWEPQPHKGDASAGSSSTVYSPTPVSMSMIRVFQSQLKNLMHEIWKERSEREDSVRNYKEKCQNDVEELQLEIRHLTRNLDRVREEHIMEKELQQEQEQQQRESQYYWRNNENDKSKLEKLETQLQKLTEQVQLLMEKSNDTHLMVKEMKSEKEEFVEHITNMVNEKIEAKLQNISSESAWMTNIQQIVKQELQGFCENTAIDNKEHIRHMIHDATKENALVKSQMQKEQSTINDKTFTSVWDAREQTLRNEMNVQINKAAMQHKEELTELQRQMHKYSDELEELKEQMKSEKILEREETKHFHQDEERNEHAVDKEECKQIIAQMLEPLVRQLSELESNQEKQQLQSQSEEDENNNTGKKRETLETQLQKLENELHELKQHVQGNYCAQLEMHRFMQELQDTIKEVKQTVNGNNNIYTNDVIKSSAQYLEVIAHDAVEKLCTERLNVLLQQETRKEKEEELLFEVAKIECSGKGNDAGATDSNNNTNLQQEEKFKEQEHDMETFLSNIVQHLHKEQEMEEEEEHTNDSSDDKVHGKMANVFVDTIATHVMSSHTFKNMLQRYIDDDNDHHIKSEISKILNAQLELLKEQFNSAHAQLQNETHSSISTLHSSINETMSERLQEQYASLKEEMALLHVTINNNVHEVCNKENRELSSDIRQEISNTERKMNNKHNALIDKLNSFEQQLMETQHEIEYNREEHKRTSDTHEVYISDLQNDCRSLHDQLEQLSSENAWAVSQQRVSRELEQEVMNYVDKHVEMLDSSHEVEVSELINTLSTVHDSIAQCVSRASQTLETQSLNKSDKQNKQNINQTDSNDTVTKKEMQQQRKSAKLTKFANLEEVITFIMEQIVFLRKAAEILQFNSNEMLSIIASHEEEIITGVPLQQHVLGELIKYMMRLQTQHPKLTSSSLSPSSQQQQQQQREESDFSQRPSSLYTADVHEPSIEPLEPQKQNDPTLNRLLTMLIDAQAQEHSEYM